MLRRIETKENIPDFIEGVKEGDERLMGFGHRVYKNYDPRAKIIKTACDEVFEVTGTNPLLDIALELEKRRARGRLLRQAQALPERRLLLGPDLRGAAACRSRCSRCMFAIPRTCGWIAQWLEMIEDKEQKIARPRQIYTGERTRDYVARSATGASSQSARRSIGCNSQPMLHALADGTPVLIRPVGPGDKPRLAAGHGAAERRERRLRFLAAKPTLSGAELRYLTEVDGVGPPRARRGARRRPRARRGRRALRARWRRGPETAEFAIVVGDPLQGLGLGRPRSPARWPRPPARAGHPPLQRPRRWPRTSRVERLLERVAARVEQRPAGGGVRELLAELPPRRPERARRRGSSDSAAAPMTEVWGSAPFLQTAVRRRRTRPPRRDRRGAGAMPAGRCRTRTPSRAPRRSPPRCRGAAGTS